MNTTNRRGGVLCYRAISLIVAPILFTTLSSRLRADTGNCDGQMITLPFTDVSAGNIFFCSIAEAFLTGLTNGTDSSHYSPSATVPREQMAAFISRSMDASVKRSVKRAAFESVLDYAGRE